MNQKRKPRKRRGRSARQATLKSAVGPEVATPSDFPSHNGGRPVGNEIKTSPERKTRSAAKATQAADTRRGSAASADDTESAVVRVMEKAAQPGAVITYLVVFALVVVGWRWPRYVVDPTSASGNLHHAITAAIAALLFLSFSTLTFLAYCLLFGTSSKTSQKFLAAVLNRAIIGATLGTLLGIRMAPALLDPSSGGSATFPNYLGDVGNAITLLTLVLISTLWPHSFGAFRQAVIDSFDRDPLRRVPVSLRKWAVMPFALGINYIGGSLALVVYFELNRH